MTRFYGRIPHPETPVAAAAYPLRTVEGFGQTDRTRRSWKHGPSLDQGQFGTCVGNALAHRIADGPVLVDGIDEDYARQLYFDATGDDTYQQGTSALAACRVLQARGTITKYSWAAAPDEFRTGLLEHGSLCAGTDWYASMDDTVLRFGAEYLKVDRASGVRGGHEYELVAIDLAPLEGLPYVVMKNSWGTSWGIHGCARIDLADFEELVFNHGGDLVLIHETPPVV